MKKKRGMVLGKFMPPHFGHLYLVEFARQYVEELTVVVGSLAAEPIPGALRAEWMRELFPFPDVKVVHLTDENPQLPEESPHFWEIWTASLQRVLPARPDCVFASEDYGWKLAEVLGAEFVPVDPKRSVHSISATEIRRDPWSHWQHLPRCVRPWFLRRVSIFGPECTGKTTLANSLAAHFQTTAVPEYARIWLEARGTGAVTPADIERIARGQLAAEEALAPEANRVLFCDTDLLTTSIWSEALFGDCPAWIEQAAGRQQYHLTLLTDIDVPWVADPVRYLPDQRASFMERCLRELERTGRRYVRLSGSAEQRLQTAYREVESLFAPDPAKV